MNIIINLILPFLVSISSMLFTPESGKSVVRKEKLFTHPGLLNSKKELAFIRKQVNARQDPWWSGYQELAKRAPEYLQAKPHVYQVVTANRGRRDPDTSRDDMTYDGEAVYANALLYTLTGKEVHARKAVEMINSWAVNFKSIKGDDSTLAVSYSFPHFIWGAEIIRSSYKGWHDAEQKQFEQLLRKLVYPVGTYYRHRNNWRSWAICLQMATGIYLNDRPIFDQAVAGYREHVNYYITDQGYCREICRDLWHTQMGIAPLIATAEMAYHQGVNLFPEANDKLYKGTEHMAAILLGDLSQWPCHQAPVEADRGFWNMYEMAYHHFKKRAKLPAPNTEKVVRKTRPEKYSRIGYGTLTHAVPL